MINAVRTLLMNRAVAGTHYTAPGEEFIEPDFVPKQRTGSLRRAMQYLLGTKPDRLYLNYRMRQLMQLLHSTELESRIYKLDNRVTYLPISNTQFFDQVFGREYNQYAGIANVPLTIHGEHVADDGAGITTHQWGVTVLNTTQIRVNRLTPPTDLDNVVDFTSSNGFSGYVPLHGTGLQFRFPTASAVGAKWIVTSKARPAIDLTVKLEAFFGALEDSLLTETFRMQADDTLENSFRDNDLLPYKASGVLIALAEYMNTLPQDE